MASSSVVLDRAGLVLGVGVAAVALAAPGVGSWASPLAIALIVSWIVWRDGVSFTIPDGAVAALAMIGVASRLSTEGASVVTALELFADVALTSGLLWLMREGFYRLRGHEGLGLGDVKLAAAAGCLVGAAGFAVALLAASVAGLVYAVLRGVGRTDRIAFGVLLAPAIGLVWGFVAFAPDLVTPNLLAPLGVAG